MPDYRIEAMPEQLPAALVESNTVAIACISMVIFLANAASACSWSLVTVVALYLVFFGRV